MIVGQSTRNSEGEREGEMVTGGNRFLAGRERARRARTSWGSRTGRARAFPSDGGYPRSWGGW